MLFGLPLTRHSRVYVGPIGCLFMLMIVYPVLAAMAMAYFIGFYMWFLLVRALVRHRRRFRAAQRAAGITPRLRIIEVSEQIRDTWRELRGRA